MHNQMNGNVLAYIGDAVISLYVREYLVNQGFTRPKDLQEKSIKYVSAKGQAKFMDTVFEKDCLSEKELDVFKRGRNANKGAVAKNVDVVVYRVASGFEALIGYLYYEDKERMNELLELLVTTQ